MKSSTYLRKFFVATLDGLTADFRFSVKFEGISSAINLYWITFWFSFSITDFEFGLDTALCKS